MNGLIALMTLIVSLTMPAKTSTEVVENINEDEIISYVEESSGEALEISAEAEENVEVVKVEEPEEIVYENISVNSTMPYYIKINRTQNVVNIYSKNEDGTYAPYKVMLCSTGTATPASGKIHKITTYKTRWNGLQGNVYGQYATQIVGNILFHSVPYTAKSNSALEYWEYDKLGTSASLGCVRLTVEDAKWIYDNIEAGTSVEFYEDENPGPFGKPTAAKISDNESNRGWDPTDMAEGNPWHVN